MDHPPPTDTLVKPTTPMDASDALYLDTLCDRRDAAMLSPFTGADGLLASDEEVPADGSGGEPNAPPASSN